MSFFSRKRNTSQVATGQLPPNVTVAQTPSQALAQTRENGERIAASSGQQSSRDRNGQNTSGPAPVPAPALALVPASAPGSNPSQPARPTFPWSTRRIALLPPLYLPRPGVPPPTGPSPSPFPRYGHSLPLSASLTGELFLFGGLVRESVRNDLYSFNTRDLSATSVETTGEIPVPRVGHASALVSSVLIIWGGDTKQRDSDKQDEGLYLLNLGTREWTRVATRGPAPAGRYGHSVAMIGSRFFMFGGQVDGEFLNDLWCFDLNTLKSSPLWEQVKPAPGNEPPPRRTGHIMLSMDDTLYVFGGTDGSYHYNDTWAFDVNTRTWQELTCIGYIPVPREGHAAAVVDDVMYVFGGRGVDGKDLNDLAAFKITNRRWFMFQNMGPSPSGRSGHAMATAGSRVFVLGGESFTSPKADDPMMIHVLDTKHIKYPDPKASSTNPSSSNNATSTNNISSSNSGRRAQQQQQQQPAAQGPPNGPQRAISPPTGSDTDDNRRNMVSPTGGGRVPGPSANGPMQSFPSSGNKRPPTRPPRDEQGASDLAQVRAGVSDVEAAQDLRQRMMSPESMRSKSPTGMGAARSMSPNGPAPTGAGMPRGPNTTRSPSPGGAPSDAFVYNAKSPSLNGFTNGRVSPVVARPGSTSNIAADLVRDLRTKDAELETLRKRETWMRAALSKASKAGFSWTDIPVDDADDIKATESENADIKKLLELAFKLKQDRASLQATLVEQTRSATDRFAEIERVRAAALQEAAFCRAKLTAYENGKPGEVSRLDNERTIDLERKIERALTDQAASEKKIASLNETLATEGRLREQFEERMADLNQRALQAEAVLERKSAEHAELLDKQNNTATDLRSATERLMTLGSSSALRNVDSPSSAEVTELRASRDQHLRALEQTQLALEAASARADEVEEQWRRADDQLQRLQADYADLHRELDAKNAELDSATARVRDIENRFAKSREEAGALRALPTRYLDYHKDMRAEEQRAGRVQSEKVNALQEEAENLRDMLKAANHRHEESQNELAREKKKVRAIESEQVALRSQISGVRSQFSQALADVARARKELANKEDEIRESSKHAMDTELRFRMFRNYLSENGVVVDEEELAASSSGGSRLNEVEARLAERTREQEALNRQLRVAQEQSQAAEERVAALAAELARAKERRSSDDNGEARVVEAERKLAEAENAHKERLQALEQDYRTAVICIKKTEKAIGKMKDELTKQKGLNASLQSELEGWKSGSEGGSKVRAPNGRVTPGSDDGQESALRTQLVEAQRQTQRLTAENQELHRKVDFMRGDMDRLRRELDALQHEADNRLSRIEMLEDENERLEGSMSMMRKGDGDALAGQLQRENATLRKENEQLSQRIELLLEVDQGANQRASDASMGASVNMESISSQLDDWNRQYGGNGAPNAHNDYDHDHR